MTPADSEYETAIAAWKARHGLDPKRDVNLDELLMAVEESRSKESSWCMECDKEMPVREMKLVTRAVDPYFQSDDGPTDYIAIGHRVRLCPECYKAKYEDEEGEGPCPA